MTFTVVFNMYSLSQMTSAVDACNCTCCIKHWESQTRVNRPCRNQLSSSLRSFTYSFFKKDLNVFLLAFQIVDNNTSEMKTALFSAGAFLVNLLTDSQVIKLRTILESRAK